MIKENKIIVNNNLKTATIITVQIGDKSIQLFASHKEDLIDNELMILVDDIVVISERINTLLKAVRLQNIIISLNQ